MGKNETQRKKNHHSDKKRKFRKIKNFTSLEREEKMMTTKNLLP